MAKNTLAFPEIGWAIQVPINCKLSNAKEIALIDKNGKEMLEKANKSDLMRPGSRTIFHAQQERFNAISCSVSPVAGRSDFEKYTIDRKSKEFVLELWQSRMRHAKLDNRTSTEWIGGKEFDDFQIVIRVGDKILFRNHYYSAEINDYNIEISVFYQNNKMGENFIRSLRESKFS